MQKRKSKTIHLRGIKMKTKHVVVVEYQTNWVDAFHEIQTYLRKTVPERFPIEHVGSTSVEGLSAKPVIDVDIVYENEEDRELLIAKLCELEYVHEGELGIPFREAFKYENLPLHKHHLYVVKAGSKAHKDHIYLREYLREHAEDKKQYGLLKDKLARKFPSDIDSYMNGKHAFIEELLRKADKWMKERKE